MPRTVRVADANVASAERRFDHQRMLAAGTLQRFDNVADSNLQHVLELHRFHEVRGRHHLAHQHIDVPHASVLRELDRSFAKNIVGRDDSQDDSRFADDEERANAARDHRLVGFIDTRSGSGRYGFDLCSSRSSRPSPASSLARRSAAVGFCRR